MTRERLGPWAIEATIATDGVTRWSRAERSGERAMVRRLEARSEDPLLVERFLALAAVLRRIDHPGVPRIRHVATTEEGEPYHVLVPVVGEEPPAGDPARLMLAGDRVLSALAACHAAGVLLTAIVPSRTLASEDGTIVLLDVGLRELVGPLAGAPRYDLAPWVAPEVAAGAESELDPRADVFAAGAYLFTRIARRPPRRAATPEATWALAATQAIPSIASVAPSTPPALAAIVDRALSFRSRERFADAASMRAAIAALRPS